MGLCLFFNVYPPTNELVGYNVVRGYATLFELIP